MPEASTPQMPVGRVQQGQEPELAGRSNANAFGADRRRPITPTVSVIVPTYNEAANVEPLIQGLSDALDGIEHEIIIVDDDSPDGTWQRVEELRRQWPRVRLIRRTSERGLSSAVVTGMAAATGSVLAVIDADGQHDEQMLPKLIAPILDGTADVSVGSRDAPGGSYGDWSPGRRAASWLGAEVAKRVVGVDVSDPMSGYFAVSRDRYEAVETEVNPRGFKILLEFVARGPTPQIAAVGYSFGQRTAGATKLGLRVIFEFVLAMIDLFAGRVVSSTLMAYMMVGASGLAVRLAALAVFDAAGVASASLVALQLSIVWNFWANNQFTFRPFARRRLHLVSGLILFEIISLQGWAVALSWSRLVDVQLDNAGPPSWLGLLSGMTIATVFNYHLNRSITWRADRRGQ